MKHRIFLFGRVILLLAVFLTAPISDVIAQDGNPPVQTVEPLQGEFDVVNDYFSVINTPLVDGRSLTAQRINGPSEPPDLAAWEASRVTALDRAATMLPNFPSYSWVLGCSAVSGAMIAGYYDHNNYANMYTGQTNWGLMPLTDTIWSSWLDSVGDRYPNNPLVASHNDIDFYVGRGSIEDYWVEYYSFEDDPYITNNWDEHEPGPAIGDYMKTSQSAYDNIDGSTIFFTWENDQDYSHEELSCSYIEDAGFGEFDGTVGRKTFYESRGYTVTDCFNQYIDAVEPGGFSLADYKAEIDAGHPVMVNLEGHTVVGFGYEGSRIYIRDTWDNDPENIYYIDWGSYYPQNVDPQYRLYMQSVSIVHLEESREFSKVKPADMTMDVLSKGLWLSWEESAGALSYEYCYNTTADPTGTCDPWISTGTKTTVVLPQLENYYAYYWQVRAISAGEITYANGEEDSTWIFRTGGPTDQNFFPLMFR